MECWIERASSWDGSSLDMRGMREGGVFLAGGRGGCVRGVGERGELARRW